jgi:hypothetical protein
VRAAAAQLRTWTARRWAFAAGVALIAAVVTGIPTDLIDTPLFGRTIDVTAWAYPVWVLASLLTGLLVATELRPGRPAAGGGVLALFAVACPVCAKPAVALLGASGAVNLFAPVQPVLGALAIAVLAGALVVRLRRAACSVPAASEPAPARPEPAS